MYRTRSLALLALSCGLVWAAPAAAHDHGGRGSYQGGGGNVPSRIANRVARAEAALERAQAKADDGDATGAQSALASARRNLSAALKSAKRRVVVDGTNGPDAIGAVTKAQHDAIVATAGLFDGNDDGLVTANADTLKSALDGRDEAVAAIAALPAASQGDYEYVLESIDSDITDELDAVDSALSDDTLTAEGRAALEQAKTQLQASQAAVRALAPADTGSTTTGVAADEGDTSGDGDCHGQRGSGSGSGSGSGTSTRRGSGV